MKYNRIYKPKKFDNFTIIPSYILRHKGISIGATGLYAYLFSHKSIFGRASIQCFELHSLQSGSSFLVI